eukprot:scaffold49615_cov26-Tisochrysis_lutea.AAC.1
MLCLSALQAATFCRQCSTYCSSRMTPLSTEACPRLTPASMWPAIARTYEQAQSSGAASKTETTVRAVPLQVLWALSLCLRHVTLCKLS